jgi:hypothetical protein
VNTVEWVGGYYQCEFAVNTSLDAINWAYFPCVNAIWSYIYIYSIQGAAIVNKLCLGNETLEIPYQRPKLKKFSRGNGIPPRILCPRMASHARSLHLGSYASPYVQFPGKYLTVVTARASFPWLTDWDIGFTKTVRAFNSCYWRRSNKQIFYFTYSLI